MSQPEPEPAPAEARWAQPVEIICDECGERVAVQNPAELIRALHLSKECAVVSSLMTPPA